MPGTGCSTTIVPYGADNTVYLVADRFRNASFYREAEIEQTDLETTFIDLLDGQFHDSVMVIALNTLEHCSDYASADVAMKSAHCGVPGEPVADNLSDFVDNYARPARQLRFRLS